MLNHIGTPVAAPTKLTAKDFKNLPTKQDLIVEVLMARHRLGEPFFPIDIRLDKALTALSERGIVEVWTDTPSHHRARLTDAAQQYLFVEKTYKSPLEKQLVKALADIEAFKRTIRSFNEEG
ncbi:hypothetical protein [Curtobacterium sp. MCSS17_016]|uniref:hypothetical protein n=1 Tax=Curtobacterium sp. MCSS17_016 TaxID=2175644 RepID=UPI000DA76000|nr:hypothetical protein [Curtobacterium sp. MCSS17_016]WIE81235.1 hypothetical protein DEJ19_018550 [Curtobacterium sp. MCSS17_016]